LEEEAAIRNNFLFTNIILANRRFFLLLINNIPVIQSASEGSPSLFLELTEIKMCIKVRLALGVIHIWLFQSRDKEKYLIC
jgi:hypothetical protein